METLFDILSTRQDALFGNEAKSASFSHSPQTTTYLTRLSTLSLSDLTHNEPASLQQASQSHARNIQALAKRSHKAVISSSDHLQNLTSILPSLVHQSKELRENLPTLETAALDFAAKYERSAENAVLDRRKRAMLLNRNVDRVTDVLDLPSLLASSVSAAQLASTSSASSAAISYSSALDLSAHVKRLNLLYPQSRVVKEISQQVEAEVQNLRSILAASLQSPNLRLASAMRTIGWLRRLMPELSEIESASNPQSLAMASDTNDSGLGALFLICRLRMLHQMLAALEPLKELADQETSKRSKQGDVKKRQPAQPSHGSQSERYLKRYIEIFREQTFNIVSMYKSIFPNGLPLPTSSTATANPDTDILLPFPTAAASFAIHLVEMLSTTLRRYMPNVADSSARESLLTQILYCAGSLGRLGAEFGMFITLLEGEISAGQASNAIADEPEWSQVMMKHRIQASRLEVLARGVGNTRKVSAEMLSPTASAA